MKYVNQVWEDLQVVHFKKVFTDTYLVLSNRYDMHGVWYINVSTYKVGFIEVEKDILDVSCYNT